MVTVPNPPWSKTREIIIAVAIPLLVYLVFAVLSTAYLLHMLNEPQLLVQREFYVVTIVLIGLAFILSFIPISLLLSLLLGTYRERIKGDVWTDIKRLGLDKQLIQSARIEQLTPAQVDERNDESIAFKRLSDRIDGIYGRSAYIIPTLLYFMLSVGGWLLVFFPAGIAGAENMYASGLQGYWENIYDAASLISYAFVGAYIWSLADLLRRYWISDLKPQSFSQAIFRLLAGVIVTQVIEVAFLSNPYPSFSPILAFFSGILTFPILEYIWRFVIERLATIYISRENLSFELNRHSITRIPGITMFNADRLREQGIEDFHFLTTVDIVDLLAQVRYPTNSIIDWIDKAMLIRHVEDDQLLSVLRQKMGIQSATDILDTWKNNVEHRTRFAAGVAREYYGIEASKPQIEQIEIRLATIIESIERNPNIRPIARYWVTIED